MNFFIYGYYQKGVGAQPKAVENLVSMLKELLSVCNSQVKIILLQEKRAKVSLFINVYKCLSLFIKAGSASEFGAYKRSVLSDIDTLTVYPFLSMICSLSRANYYF